MLVHLCSASAKTFPRNLLLIRVKIIIPLCKQRAIMVTRVKTQKLLHVCKRFVTSLFTNCQQVEFALLVPSLL